MILRGCRHKSEENDQERPVPMYKRQTFSSRQAVDFVAVKPDYSAGSMCKCTDCIHFPAGRPRISSSESPTSAGST